MATKKGKGADFEREVSRKLSLWISAGNDPDIYWRSTASGARATRRGNNTLAHEAGDISASKPEGFPLLRRFYVECKFYADLQLARFLVNKPSKLGAFWTVARKQALCYQRRRVLLVAKQNLHPVLILMEPRSFRDFDLHGKGWYLANESVVVLLFGEFLINANTAFLTGRARL